MADSIIDVTIKEEVYSVNVNPETITANVQGVGIIQRVEGSDVFMLSAGEVISALKCVYSDDGKAKVCNASDSATSDLFIGISINSAGINQDVTIRADGIISDNNFNFVSGQIVFIGSNGELTQTISNQSYVQIIGIALENKKIKLCNKQSIKI